MEHKKVKILSLPKAQVGTHGVVKQPRIIEVDSEDDPRIQAEQDSATIALATNNMVQHLNNTPNANAWLQYANNWYNKHGANSAFARAFSRLTKLNKRKPTPAITVQSVLPGGGNFPQTAVQYAFPQTHVVVKPPAPKMIEPGLLPIPSIPIAPQLQNIPDIEYTGPRKQRVIVNTPQGDMVRVQELDSKRFIDWEDLLGAPLEFSNNPTGVASQDFPEMRRSYGKFAYGGDISIPDLRRVKIDALPKAQYGPPDWRNILDYQYSAPAQQQFVAPNVRKVERPTAAASTTSVKSAVPTHYANRTKEEVKAVEADWEKAHQEQIAAEKAKIAEQAAADKARLQQAAQEHFGVDISQVDNYNKYDDGTWVPKTEKQKQFEADLADLNLKEQAEKNISNRKTAGEELTQLAQELPFMLMGTGAYSQAFRALRGAKNASPAFGVLAPEIKALAPDAAEIGLIESPAASAVQSLDRIGSSLNLQRAAPKVKRSMPSFQIEPISDQLSIMHNPTRLRENTLESALSKIKPGDTYGRQFKSIRYSDKPGDGYISLMVAKDEAGEPFFYFSANMDHPIHAGRAFSKLDEFIPSGSFIQEPHSLSLDSWSTMLRRAKSGKFSWEPAGHVPLNKSAIHKANLFSEYTLPETMRSGIAGDKYYFSDLESAQPYLDKIRGFIPKEITGIRPTLGSEYFPGATAREYQFIQVPNLRLKKLLYGGWLKRAQAGLTVQNGGMDWEGLSNPELLARARAMGHNTIAEYRNSNWGYGKNMQQAPGRGAAIGVGLDTQLPKSISLKSPKPITTMPLAVKMNTRSNMPPLDQIFAVRKPEQSGVGQFLGNPNAKAAPLNYEDRVNEWLGKPMDKAYDAAERASEDGSDPVDNFRHPVAGMYTQQAIKDKVGIPIVGDALGFLGANAMGIGHEAGTIFRDDRPWDVKLREAGEDIFNNFTGSLTGLLPGTQENKENILYNLSAGNWLPDGVVWNGNQNMYFKDENGNIPRTSPSEMWDKLMGKKQGGVVKKVKIKSLPNNWKTK